MSYANVDLSEVQGELLADFLIGIEADFTVEHDGLVILDEPSFPVAELARDLEGWMQSGPQGNFAFDSMSADLPDLIAIQLQDSGWVVYSGWTPSVVSQPVATADISASVRQFIDAIRRDLEALGLNASWILDPSARS